MTPASPNFPVGSLSLVQLVPPFVVRNATGEPVELLPTAPQTDVEGQATLSRVAIPPGSFSFVQLAPPLVVCSAAAPEPPAEAFPTAMQTDTEGQAIENSWPAEGAATATILPSSAVPGTSRQPKPDPGGSTNARLSVPSENNEPLYNGCRSKMLSRLDQGACRPV
jgi:hypothetical protein